MIHLDSAGPVPPSEQIRSQLSALIRSGDLAAGDRLPSVRQLAADLRIAPGTVARAFKALDAAGLTESSRSAGTRVRAGNAIDEPLSRSAAQLVGSISDSSVQLDDILAAVTTAWNRRGKPSPG